MFRAIQVTINLGDATKATKAKAADAKPKAAKTGPKAKIAKKQGEAQKTKKITKTTTITTTTTASLEKKQCQHFKKNGVQCNNAVTKGNVKYCHVHTEKKKKKARRSMTLMPT